MEHLNEAKNSQTNFKEEVMKFYQSDFKNLFLNYFKNPLEGQEYIFKNPSKDTYSHSLILFGSVFLIYLVGYYIIAGDMRSYMGFGDYLKIASLPIILMICISVFSFILKSFFGTNTDIKSELLTGALCGIPLATLIPISMLGKIFDINLMSFISNMKSSGLVIALIFLYLILLLINTLYQSLISGGIRSVIAWYISPLIIVISIFIAFSFTGGMY